MDGTNAMAKYPELGRRIKSARRDSSLTLDRLAERVGTSRHHLIRLEKGNHMPTDPMLAAIARETGKDLSFFLELDEDDEEAAAAVPLSIDEVLHDYVRRLVALELAGKLPPRLAESVSRGSHDADSAGRRTRRSA